MIEHVAKAVFPSDYYVSPEVVTELVTAHVDAILDYLEANRIEWNRGAMQAFKDAGSPEEWDHSWLTAALRIQESQP
jgi:hypothetical protein